MPLKQIYLSLGSNVGDRERNLQDALSKLEDSGVHVTAQSSLYETAPQDVLDQPWFVNIAAEAETGLFPIQLIEVIQKVERSLGRVRGRNTQVGGPRTIDIDILLYGSVCMETQQLVIPHPRMLQRRFVLEPLLEIAPQLRHPKANELVSRFLKDVKDQTLRKLNPH